MLKSLFGPQSLNASPHEKRERRELLAIDGEPVAVNVRFNPRARRMVMRVHPVSGEVTVTAPSRTSLAAALAFARGETGWIARQRGQMPPAIAFAPGAHGAVFRRAASHLAQRRQRARRRCGAKASRFLFPASRNMRAAG